MFLDGVINHPLIYLDYTVVTLNLVLKFLIIEFNINENYHSRLF